MPGELLGLLGGLLEQRPGDGCGVLGGRQLGQGIALLLRPARSTVAASAAVDGLHALTMVAAAIGWPRYRRVSAASGAVAVATGVLAVASAR